MLNKYKKIFITGTDTNVGKTYYSVKLLREFNAKGFSTIGVKPISTGYDIKSKINDDAEKLYDASSIKIPINEVNPFSFKEPISPNIAAKKENVDLSVEKMVLSHLLKSIRIFDILKEMIDVNNAESRPKINEVFQES